MSAWHSPGKIWSISHRAVRSLFGDEAVEVQVQEKVDGSFFAFGIFPEPSFGGDVELKVRSKGAVMVVDAPEGMFKSAVDTVKSLQDQLKVGWMYRGECLNKPRHNALNYDRVPKGNVILFDICREEEDYLTYEELKAEGDRLGLEVVPQLYVGKITTAEQIRAFLDTTSILGGQKIEGVVLKPIEPLYDQDKKLLMAKFVSEAFKEVHNSTWKNDNPTTGDILELLGNQYQTAARWNKSVVHAREEGLLDESPKDIGLLIKKIQADVKEECEEEIKEKLFQYAWKHLARKVTAGFPEYWKDLLLRSAFETNEGPEQGLAGGGDGTVDHTSTIAGGDTVDEKEGVI